MRTKKEYELIKPEELEPDSLPTEHQQHRKMEQDGREMQLKVPVEQEEVEQLEQPIAQPATLESLVGQQRRSMEAPMSVVAVAEVGRTRLHTVTALSKAVDVQQAKVALVEQEHGQARQEMRAFVEPSALAQVARSRTVEMMLK